MRSAIVPAAMLVLLFSGAAQGEPFQILHTFCAKENCADGELPIGGVTLDARGNLYGTTEGGGTARNGTVYELKRRPNGQFKFETLYSFCPLGNCSHGAAPQAPVVLDTSGNLYGTTAYGGLNNNGTVYELKPQADGKWTQVLLQVFRGSDGSIPASALTYAGAAAGLPYDGTSPLYGTTALGGTAAANEGGTAYTLTPNGAGWTFQTIFDFDTQGALGGIIGPPFLDAAGNLYGASFSGPEPNGSGVVFKLVPAGAGWTGEALYTFCTQCNDKTAKPQNLTMDATGALVGTAEAGGPECLGNHGRRCSGNVFKLTPDGANWDYTALHDFCFGQTPCHDGQYASATPVIDAAGNVYGVTASGGRFRHGVLFRIQTDGTYTILHDFCNPRDCRDGQHPSGLAMDAAGHLYGVAEGMVGQHGTIYEYTP